MLMQQSGSINWWGLSQGFYLGFVVVCALAVCAGNLAELLHQQQPPQLGQWLRLLGCDMLALAAIIAAFRSFTSNRPLTTFFRAFYQHGSTARRNATHAVVGHPECLNT